MTTETKQEGWVARGLTAVCEKLFTWVCQHQIELSPAEYQQFLSYSSSIWVGTQTTVYPRQSKEETES